MRKHLISAYVQLSFSYILKEITQEEYLELTAPLMKKATIDEIAEGVRQVNEAIKDKE